MATASLGEEGAPSVLEEDRRYMKLAEAVEGMRRAMDGLAEAMREGERRGAARALEASLKMQEAERRLEMVVECQVRAEARNAEKTQEAAHATQTQTRSFAAATRSAENGDVARPNGDANADALIAHVKALEKRVARAEAASEEHRQAAAAAAAAAEAANARAERAEAAAAAATAEYAATAGNRRAADVDTAKLTALQRRLDKLEKAGVGDFASVSEALALTDAACRRNATILDGIKQRVEAAEDNATKLKTFIERALRGSSAAEVRLRHACSAIAGSVSKVMRDHVAVKIHESNVLWDEALRGTVAEWRNTAAKRRFQLVKLPPPPLVPNAAGASTSGDAAAGNARAPEMPSAREFNVWR